MPVSVVLSDSGGNTVFTTGGNFNGGVYSFQLPTLTTAGAADTNYTLQVVSNDLTAHDFDHSASDRAFRSHGQHRRRGRGGTGILAQHAGRRTIASCSPRTTPAR